MENEPTPKKRTDKDEPIEDSFAQIEEWQSKYDAGLNSAAQRIIGDSETYTIPSTQPVEPSTHPTTEENSGMSVGARIVAGAAGAAVIVGGGFSVHEVTKGPEFSDKSHEYVVQPGDGLENAAMDVAGARKVDIRDVEHHISVDPANIDILKDGLQPGEQIEVPNSVEK